MYSAGATARQQAPKSRSEVWRRASVYSPSLAILQMWWSCYCWCDVLGGMPIMTIEWDRKAAGKARLKESAQCWGWLGYSTTMSQSVLAISRASTGWTRAKGSPLSITTRINVPGLHFRHSSQPGKTALCTAYSIRCFISGNRASSECVIRCFV